MGIFLFFGQKETGAEGVAMATPLKVAFCFLLLSSLFHIKNNILVMCVLKFVGGAYDYCTEKLAVLCQGKPGNRLSAS